MEYIVKFDDVTFKYDDELNVKCPENTILLFEIIESTETDLYGVNGRIERKTSKDIYIVTESYEKGTYNRRSSAF